MLLPTRYSQLTTYHLAHLQADAKLRCALQQQIFIGYDHEGNIRRRDGKLDAQIGAYACRFTGGDRQRN